MGTGAPIPMPINDDVLTLTQWLSPGYPVGAFAYSHGLEAAADAGWITDGASCESWLLSLLQNGSGRSDALFLAAAWHAPDATALRAIDQTARAFAPTRERLFETTTLGAAFAQITSRIWGTDAEDLTYPVAMGAAAHAHGIDKHLTLELYLHAFLANLIACGQRLLPIGQTQAQAMLRRLTAEARVVAQDSADGDLERLSSHVFLSDIAAMKHETQYSRIFRT